jgi:hypothetical protein
MTASHPAQFFIDERHQLLKRKLISFAPIIQQKRYLVRICI